MAGRSIGGSFQGSALSASIPMIVSEKHLVRANGLNMTLRGANNIVAPLAGAFLIEAIEMQWVLTVDIITAIFTVTSLAFFSRDLMNIEGNKVEEKPREETSLPIPELKE